MPKEVVRHTVVPRNAISVGWEKDCDARLGVSVPNWFRFTDKNGEPLKDVGDDEVFDSLWFTFTTRYQMNELIRNLQKARDKAFGKDA